MFFTGNFVSSTLPEDLQIVLVSEDAVTGGVSSFLQDAKLLQLFDGCGGGVKADAQRGSGALDIDDRILLQIVKHCPDIVFAPRGFRKPRDVVFVESRQLLCGLQRVCCGAADGLQEETDPLLVVAASADLADAVIVLHLILLQKVGYIDDRLAQQLAFHQVEQDQQSADASVTV